MSFLAVAFLRDPRGTLPLAYPPGLLSPSPQGAAPGNHPGGTDAESTRLTRPRTARGRNSRCFRRAVSLVRDLPDTPTGTLADQRSSLHHFEALAFERFSRTAGRTNTIDLLCPGTGPFTRIRPFSASTFTTGRLRIVIRTLPM